MAKKRISQMYYRGLTKRASKEFMVLLVIFPNSVNDSLRRNGENLILNSTLMRRICSLRCWQRRLKQVNY